MRKLQIGIIGSMADIKFAEKIKKLAEDVGSEIAKNNAIVLYGFEGDFESLSLYAAASAEKHGGQTIAFNWGKYRDNEISGVNTLNSMVVQTGLWRGGGREFSFILSCDAVIAIQGGMGTLTEIGIACNANIPVIALENTGGWSSKLANTFIDMRKTVKIHGAKTAKEAVTLAIKAIEMK